MRRARERGLRDAWYRYMGRVYASLVADWLDLGARAVLKTDLYEEAVSAHPPLPALGPGALGVDLSLTAAARARRRAGGGRPARCVVADLRRLPFTEGAVGAILSGSSLDHFRDRADLRAGLAELARALAPGGSIVLTLDNPHNPVVRLRNVLPARLLERLGGIPYFVGVTLRREEAERELAAVGLRLLEVRAVAHAPRAPALVACRLAERWGLRGDRLLALLLACERLARWPTRRWTAYYLAFHVERPAEDT